MSETEGNNAFMVADLEPKAPPAIDAAKLVADMNKALDAATAPTGTEAQDERLERLRKLAEAEIAKETDQEIVAQMVAEARAKRAAALLPLDTSGWPADYDVIEIFEGRDAQDLKFVPLGLNGFTIRCPRGEEIIIPHVFVTECLDHAIEDVTVRSQGGLITRPVKRFPYSFKRKATPEEYRAYQTEQKAKASRETSAFERMSA